jgi:hypothetical protein
VARFNQSSLYGSWTLRFGDGSPPAPAELLRGSVWVIPQGAAPSGSASVMSPSCAAAHRM